VSKTTGFSKTTGAKNTNIGQKYEDNQENKKQLLAFGGRPRRLGWTEVSF